MWSFFILSWSKNRISSLDLFHFWGLLFSRSFNFFNLLFRLFDFLFLFINCFLSCRSTCFNIKCHHTIFSLCLIRFIIHCSTIFNRYFKNEVDIFAFLSWDIFVDQIFCMDNFEILWLHHLEIFVSIFLFCEIKYLIPFVYFSLKDAIIISELTYYVSLQRMFIELWIF